eukprot:CAMPEP_0118927520 /NCGR_PEP_ID=MMETSP1169-20130426/4964_1 /TAXON_ID=36882 /ORGANISM="Pyramimonas obovata, Strain CCMP722" /LENGTH=512 /DNA_ID=CAMNT_0006869289 /DNA_START=460 /DNA_END=1995 /DNA_ORIENTATION=-
MYETNYFQVAYQQTQTEQEDLRDLVGNLVLQCNSLPVHLLESYVPRVMALKKGIEMALDNHTLDSKGIENLVSAVDQLSQQVTAASLEANRIDAVKSQYPGDTDVRMEEIPNQYFPSGLPQRDPCEVNGSVSTASPVVAPMFLEEQPGEPEDSRVSWLEQETSVPTVSSAPQPDTLMSQQMPEQWAEDVGWEAPLPVVEENTAGFRDDAGFLAQGSRRGSVGFSGAWIHKVSRSGSVGSEDADSALGDLLHRYGSANASVTSLGCSSSRVTSRSASITESVFGEDMYSFVQATLANELSSHPLLVDDDEERDEDEELDVVGEDAQGTSQANVGLPLRDSQAFGSDLTLAEPEGPEGPDDWLDELAIEGRCMVGHKLQLVRKSGRPLPDNVAVFWQRVRPEDEEGRQLTVQIPDEAEEVYTGTDEDLGARLRVVVARRLGPYSLGTMGFSDLSDPIKESDGSPPSEPPSAAPSNGRASPRPPSISGRTSSRPPSINGRASPPVPGFVEFNSPS